jgi:two-component system, cell cycle sensor histidine kinase and response regulator CckA
MLEPEKTKEQLVKELEEMRRRVEQLQDAWEKNEESKEDLRHSENRYRSLFEDSLDGLFEVAIDGTILDANTAYLKLFGYTREEILNTNIVNLYFEQQDRELYREEIQRTGYVRDYPLRMLTKNGRKIDCEVTATEQKNPEGTLISYRGILRDVTDRNESKKVLEKVEKNYRELVEQTNSIILRWDREGNISFLNNFGLGFFGYTASEILGRNVLGTIVPETDKAGRDLVGMIGNIFTDPKLYVKNQNENMKSNGERVWISWTNKPIYDEDGTVKEIFSIGNDHTELKNAEEELRKSKQMLEAKVLERTARLQETSERLRSELLERKTAEEALKESENRFRILIEKAPVAIAVAKGNIFKYANPQYVEMFGYDSAEDLIGRSILDLVAPSDRGIFKHRVYQRELGLPVESIYEVTGLRRDGSFVPISAAATTVDLSDGPASVGFFYDITDRIRFEKALEESRNLLRVIVDSLPVGILYVDRGERIVLANKIFGSWWGRSDEDLAGQKVEDVLDEHYFTIKGAIKAALAGQRTSYYQTVRYKDGVVRDVKTSYLPDKNVDSDVVGFTCLVTDVTELRLAEKALRENQDRLELALSGADMGTWDLDLRTGIATPNDRSLRIAGYSIDDIEPTLEFWQSLVHPDDAQIAMKDLIDNVEGRKDSIESVYRIRSKSGEYKWLQSRGKVVERDSEGNALRVAGTFTDLTIQKKAEADLKESERRSRLLIEESPVGIAIAQHGKFTFVNNEFLKIFGYENLQEVIGLRTVDLVPPEFRDLVLMRRRHNQSGQFEPTHLEIKGLKKDGRLFDLELWPRGIDYQGTRALLAFCSDKSESKSLKDQLSHAQKMEAVGILAGGIAHDFNNLLQIILGYTELLLHRDQINYATKKDLARIMTAAENGADLVHMLMTFSRKTISRLVPIDLNQRIDQIRTLLSRTIPKMIEIKLILNDRLSIINADPSQMDQILMNLAVNARDAMPDGGRLTIETDNIRLDEEYCRSQINVTPGEYAALTVSDTGTGIDKGSLEHIFEPFFTTKSLGKGTGLGLAMVFGLVRQHGGHIKCFSEPGVGTTFKLYFPSTMSEKNQTLLKQDKDPEKLGGNETVLLADDERSIRDLCEEVLVEYGYNVITASDGLEAFEIYVNHKGKIDIVILDMIMPKMDGRQCFNELFRIDPTVKVIVASGLSMQSQLQESFSGLIKGFVSKPYKASQLLKTLRNAIDSK